MPDRLRRHRTPGWVKPEGAVIVDRTSRWGNPFTVADAIAEGFATDEASARKLCVDMYRDWLTHTVPDRDAYVSSNGGRRRTWDRRWVLAHLPDLAGRDLVCACPLDGLPCHATVLIELAAEYATKET